jgi:hypothetical protein
MLRVGVNGSAIKRSKTNPYIPVCRVSTVTGSFSCLLPSGVHEIRSL